MTCYFCGRVEPPKVTRSWKYGFMRIIEERPDGWSFVGSRNRPPLRLWCGSCDPRPTASCILPRNAG